MDTSRFIFCFTTGRSGTNLLADALNSCHDVAARHEPGPILNGRSMRWILRRRPGADLLIRYKSASVRHHAKASGQTHYGDISHVFGKVYAERLVHLLGPERCTIIRLERDPVDVVTSLCALGSLPGLNAWGTHWFADSTWEGNMLRVAPRDAYEAAAWHVYEIALRYGRFQRKYPNCQYLPLKFDELVHPEVGHNWLKSVGFNPSQETERVLGQRINAKEVQKKNPVDRDAAIRAVDHFARLAAQQDSLSAKSQFAFF